MLGLFISITVSFFYYFTKSSRADLTLDEHEYDEDYNAISKSGNLIYHNIFNYYCINLCATI